MQQAGGDDDLDDLFEQAQREANARRQATAADTAHSHSVSGSASGGRDEVQPASSSPTSRSSAASSPSTSTSDMDSAKLARYANATSISSAQYFHEDDSDDADSKARLSHFSSANAIGSDAFFGREHDGEYGSSGGGGEAVDMAAIRDAAAVKARQLASFAGSILKQVRDRY